MGESESEALKEVNLTITKTKAYLELINFVEHMLAAKNESRSTVRGSGSESKRE